MKFYSTEMKNTSTRKDICDRITITLKDGMTTEVIGTANMNSFNDIYLDFPEIKGRFRLKAWAVKAMDKRCILTLDDCMRWSWWLSNGDYILKNLIRIK